MTRTLPIFDKLGSNLHVVVMPLNVGYALSLQARYFFRVRSEVSQLLIYVVLIGLDVDNWTQF